MNKIAGLYHKSRTSYKPKCLTKKTHYNIISDYQKHKYFMYHSMRIGVKKWSGNGPGSYYV